ncbi:MAG: C10 family peptidase [Dissulfurispiraceae bacterium]|jgi:hypothetical protein
MKTKSILIAIISIFMLVSSAFAATISETTVQQVAQNYLKAHVAQHGTWNGTTSPSVGDIQVATYKGTPVAYIVSIVPTGSMLIAYTDDFSPVLYYSPNTVLDDSKADDLNAIESWIFPEIYNNLNIINGSDSAHAMKAMSPSAKFSSAAGTKIANAWTKMSSPTFEVSTNVTTTPTMHALDANTATTSIPANVEPVVQTVWNQGSPFNNNVPAEPVVSAASLGLPAGYAYPGCTHAPTGCVATAMAQVMKYWNWPDQGVGGLINAPQMVVPNLAQAAPIMDRAVPG